MQMSHLIVQIIIYKQSNTLPVMQRTRPTTSRPVSINPEHSCEAAEELVLTTLIHLLNSPRRRDKGRRQPLAKCYSKATLQRRTYMRSGIILPGTRY
ncbi:jg6701 [Pararge aegeria aegeria]|uniref:Jg6701 protein n=1 Tax=Pararge aegeria aegeria TaxID=348720 RepID=A0A8S4SMB6_9NEOP|nr:jg6701 [Pararge aegeria aegeria]